MKSASEVIEFIDAIRTRKHMYFREVNADAVENFVSGFLLGLSALGVDFNWPIWNAVAEERGWKAESVAKNTLTLMRESGMTDAAIVEEQFVILVETVRRMLPESN
jgi:hypothetical protein